MVKKTIKIILEKIVAVLMILAAAAMIQIIGIILVNKDNFLNYGLLCFLMRDLLILLGIPLYLVVKLSVWIVKCRKKEKAATLKKETIVNEKEKNAIKTARIIISCYKVIYLKTKRHYRVILYIFLPVLIALFMLFLMESFFFL